VLSEVELAINSGDPTKNRDAFQTWLRHRLIFEATIAYQRLHAGAHHVAVRLANLLDLPAPISFLMPRVTEPEQLVSELPARESAPHQSPIPARLLTVFMPAYGGIVMALVFSRYLGLVLPGWLIAVCAVVAALTLGGDAASGKRSRQRERRQSHAVTAMRSTIDEYQIALIKQLRDGARDLCGGVLIGRRCVCGPTAQRCSGVAIVGARFPDGSAPPDAKGAPPTTARPADASGCVSQAIGANGEYVRSGSGQNAHMASTLGMISSFRRLRSSSVFATGTSWNGGQRRGIVRPASL
jgi:hypothetical protein